MFYRTGLLPDSFASSRLTSARYRSRSFFKVSSGVRYSSRLLILYRSWSRLARPSIVASIASNVLRAWLLKSWLVDTAAKSALISTAPASSSSTSPVSV